jgi:hypothetical protein
MVFVYLCKHEFSDVLGRCLALSCLESEELDVPELKLELELVNESDSSSASCPFTRHPKAWLI